MPDMNVDVSNDASWNVTLQLIYVWMDGDTHTKTCYK